MSLVLEGVDGGIVTPGSPREARARAGWGQIPKLLGGVEKMGPVPPTGRELELLPWMWRAGYTVTANPKPAFALCLVLL